MGELLFDVWLIDSITSIVLENLRLFFVESSLPNSFGSKNDCQD